MAGSPADGPERHRRVSKAVRDARAPASGRPAASGESPCAKDQESCVRPQCRDSAERSVRLCRDFATRRCLHGEARGVAGHQDGCRPRLPKAFRPPGGFMPVAPTIGGRESYRNYLKLRPWQEVGNFARSFSARSRPGRGAARHGRHVSSHRCGRGAGPVHRRRRRPPSPMVSEHRPLASAPAC
jgi:hypothetical protein